MALKCHFPEHHGPECPGRNPEDWSVENCNPDELSLALFAGPEKADELIERWRAAMVQEIGDSV